MRIKHIGRPILLLLILSTFIAISTFSSVKAQETTLSQRLEQYKKDRNITSKTEVQSIKLRCGVAQAGLKNLLTRVSAAQSTRAAVYKNISDSLDDLEKRLDDQAFETTNFKGVITNYKGKVTEYTNNMAAYKQALEDAIAVNCTQDTQGFKAALETARLYHDKMIPNVTDIREYASNTVKPTLTQIKEQIERGNTTGGQQ